jgi:hypothetical protein
VTQFTEPDRLHFPSLALAVDRYHRIKRAKENRTKLIQRVQNGITLILAVPIGNIGEIAVRQLGYESHDLILLIGALRAASLKENYRLAREIV